MSMTPRVSPYLRFEGSTREAMTFYQEVLGGELSLASYGEFGAAADDSQADLVMHSMLVFAADFSVMASDTPPGMAEQMGGPFTNGTIALHAGPEDLEAMSAAFPRLAEGGSVVIPLEAAPWGDHFGEVVDRFGIHWMFNIGGSTEPPAE
ncbi:VOC family protein [Brevibacterium litoralis]|uniref:VOC family protein n=1 Tax=Brevibacterium litoralis TaxID=3138935 RepID=UPI0032EE4F51